MNFYIGVNRKKNLLKIFYIKLKQQKELNAKLRNIICPGKFENVFKKDTVYTATKLSGYCVLILKLF